MNLSELVETIPREEEIVLMAKDARELRRIFGDLDFCFAIENIVQEDMGLAYGGVYELLTCDELDSNEVYFVFCNWRGGRFAIYRGKENEYVDVIADTKESPAAFDRHIDQMEAIVSALDKYDLVDSGLRYNESFELTTTEQKR